MTTTHEVTFPVTDPEEILKLRAGDEVVVQGHIIGIRDRTQIEEIEEVAWEELMPECLWKFRVKDFGPLTVGIDAHGNSLYHDVQAAAQEKLKELFARI